MLCFLSFEKVGRKQKDQRADVWDMMQYTVLDLEWNGVYSEKLGEFINEIIQFGAVRLDEKCRRIGNFSTFVRPSESRKLTGLVRQLTNITNEDLLTGVPFMQALKDFQAFSADSILLTWGPCDMRELITNFRFYTGKTELPLENDYVNLQDYCQIALGEPLNKQMGLSAAAERLGISSAEMTLHRAIDDSILSAACFERVFDAARLQKMRLPIDQRFCERMVFRAQYLTDLKNPLVDHKQLQFSCPECGGELHQEKAWEIHNRHFFTHFTCPQCQKTFQARVQYKQRYDGVQVRRRIAEKRPESEGQTEVSENED